MKGSGYLRGCAALAGPGRRLRKRGLPPSVNFRNCRRFLERKACVQQGQSSNPLVSNLDECGAPPQAETPLRCWLTPSSENWVSAPLRPAPPLAAPPIGQPRKFLSQRTRGSERPEVTL